MASGSKEDPWVLKTPPGSSEYTMYRDEQAEPPLLICHSETLLAGIALATATFLLFFVIAVDAIIQGSRSRSDPAG